MKIEYVDAPAKTRAQPFVIGGVYVRRDDGEVLLLIAHQRLMSRTEYFFAESSGVVKHFFVFDTSAKKFIDQHLIYDPNATLTIRREVPR